MPLLGPALLAALKLVGPAAIGIGANAVGQKVGNRITRKEQERRHKQAQQKAIKDAQNLKKHGQKGADIVPPIDTSGVKSGLSPLQGNFWSGYPAQLQQLSTVRPEQEAAQKKLLEQGSHLLSNLGSRESQARRNFEQKTVPSILARLSTLGTGGLQNSSGLGHILGEHANQLEQDIDAMNFERGLALQKLGLQPNFENIFHKGSPGIGEQGLNALLQNSPELFTLLSHYLSSQGQQNQQQPQGNQQHQMQPNTDLNQQFNNNQGFNPTTNTNLYDALNSLYSPKPSYPQINPNNINTSAKSALEALYGQQPQSQNQFVLPNNNVTPSAMNAFDLLYPKR